MGLRSAMFVNTSNVIDYSICGQIPGAVKDFNSKITIIGCFTLDVTIEFNIHMLIINRLNRY